MYNQQDWYKENFPYFSNHLLSFIRLKNPLPIVLACSQLCVCPVHTVYSIDFFCAANCPWIELKLEAAVFSITLVPEFGCEIIMIRSAQISQKYGSHHTKFSHHSDLLADIFAPLVVVVVVVAAVAVATMYLLQKLQLWFLALMVWVSHWYIWEVEGNEVLILQEGHLLYCPDSAYCTVSLVILFLPFAFCHEHTIWTTPATP